MGDEFKAILIDGKTIAYKDYLNYDAANTSGFCGKSKEFFGYNGVYYGA